MDSWKRGFLDKLNAAQSHWMRQFEEAMNNAVAPAFKDLSDFLRENGFKISTPLREDGRRSYKFELSENAYLLMIFRSCGMGEFELRSECFVPGREPSLNKRHTRMADVNVEWSRKEFQSALDSFVEQLAGAKSGEPRKNEELVSV
jgi:hypothetical protein